jgi:hypothetical protein
LEGTAVEVKEAFSINAELRAYDNLSPERRLVVAMVQQALWDLSGWHCGNARQSLGERECYGSN